MKQDNKSLVLIERRYYQETEEKALPMGYFLGKIYQDFQGEFHLVNYFTKEEFSKVYKNHHEYVTSKNENPIYDTVISVLHLENEMEIISWILDQPLYFRDLSEVLFSRFNQGKLDIVTWKLLKKVFLFKKQQKKYDALTEINELLKCVKVKAR